MCIYINKKNPVWLNCSAFQSALKEAALSLKDVVKCQAKLCS